MLKSLVPLTLFAALLASGCATVEPAFKLGLRNAVTSAEREEPIPVRPAAATAAESVAPTTPAGPPPELSQIDAMAKIAPALAELAAADPALHSEVLEQLKGTKPHLWSLTVQRAQHTLAYQQQLAGNLKPPVAAPTAYPIVQTSATTPIAAPTPPPLPTLVGAVTASTSAVANPYYRTASAVTPAVPPLTPIAEEEVEEEEPDPLTWREHLAMAIDRFKDENKHTRPKSHHEGQEHVRLRLLQLAAGQTEEAAVAPPGLPAREQSYWSNQLWAMKTLLQEEGDDFQAKINAAGRHQTAASAKLREMGSLKIENLSACEAIYGYGAYKPIRRAIYHPGETVSLYAEIENYRSEATDEGYHTLIGSSCRLVSSEGDEVMNREIPVIDDICYTRRRDFHLRVGILLPSSLKEGDYHLELSVTDRLANKTGKSELPIIITR